MNNILNKLYLHNLYELTKAFVQNYPVHTLKCKRLQTFAVLEEYSDLNTPNLSKTISDRNKPFFFSRDWATSNYNPSKLEYSYPGIFMIDRNFNISDPFCQKTKTCYTIEIAILDKYDRNCAEKKGKGNACSSRTRNEIFLDTENFLFYYFAYLRDIIYVEGIGWVNRKIHELSGDIGLINSVITQQFQKSLSSSNKELNGIRWSGGLDDLYGTVLELKFCIETCDEFTYDPELKDFKVGPDRGCCD